ncbi:MAG: hypothetical protein ACOCT0_06725 [Halobacteriota archaeon]
MDRNTVLSVIIIGGLLAGLAGVATVTGPVAIVGGLTAIGTAALTMMLFVKDDFFGGNPV